MLLLFIFDIHFVVVSSFVDHFVVVSSFVHFFILLLFLIHIFFSTSSLSLPWTIAGF